MAAIREIHESLDTTVQRAVELARALLAPEAEAVHQRGHLRVILDLPALEASVMRRLREALESAPVVRRGRPPAARQGRYGD